MRRMGLTDTEYCIYNGTSQVAQMVKNLPGMSETWVQSLAQEDPLEEVDGNTLGVRAGTGKGGVIIMELPFVACQAGGGGFT